MATSEDAGQAEMQRLADEANAKGYIGTPTDPTPDESYTISGVTSDAPTPETDPALAAEADKAAGLTPDAQAESAKPKKEQK